MKIEIHKENGMSHILLDGKSVENGCMGFEITSQGAGPAIVTLKYITKDLDFSTEVDAPISEKREVRQMKRSLR